MSGLSVTLSSKHLENLPHLYAAHIAADGKAEIGCDLVAETKIAIYPDKATVFTVITASESVSPEMKETLDSHFLGVVGLTKGDPMVISLFGPVLNNENLSEQEHSLILRKTGKANPLRWLKI